MPSLNWVGKEAVINHDKEVPFKLLKKVKSASVGENSQNLIIHGDNLEALKALMPYYGGKIKCIFIDPPYNTGGEKWVYNDRVNSPKIKKWLGKVVGSQSEDLCRHDKWLCMMYPRLKLLRDLLSEDGVIFVSIDDNEHCDLKHIFDEIFLEDNFITTFIWKKKGTSTNVAGAQVSSLTDFIICYGKTEKAKLMPRIRLKETRDYPHEDKEGKYRLTIIEKKNAGEYIRESMQFPILGTKPRVGKRWQIGIEKAMELEKKGRFINEKGTIKLKIYDFEDKDTYSAQPNLLDDHGTTDSAARMLAEIFGKQEVFSNPKPIELIKHLIGITTKKDDVVLDSFAGSGTTGHAVLDLNKEDSGERKFIIIEMEDNVSRDMTAERIKRAIKKYDYSDGFEYCELGKPLFNEEGQIEEECSFEQLATYIYFTETNTNLDKKVVSGNVIGEYGDIQYYLLFKGKGKNILNKDFLKKLPKSNNKKVIYADKCLIDDKILAEYNIQFKQIPYEVKVY
jgi:adenine-specific DNA-methyltransferase